MAASSRRGDRAWRNLLLVQQLSADLSTIGYEVLGTASTDNRAIQLLALLLDGSMPSHAVAPALDMPAPAAYRLLRRLDDDGMIRRTRSKEDGRRIDVALSATGRQRIAHFESRLAAYCAESADLLAQIAEQLGEGEPSAIPSPPPRPVLVMAALGTAGADYRDAVDATLAKHGLLDDTARFALCLIAVEQPVRPRVIARQFGMTAGGVTALLDRLQSAGHIRRVHDDSSGDRRTVLVSTTPRGARAAADILEVFTEHAPAFARTAAIAGSLTGTAAKRRSASPARH